MGNPVATPKTVPRTEQMLLDEQMKSVCVCVIVRLVSLPLRFASSVHLSVPFSASGPRDSSSFPEERPRNQREGGPARWLCSRAFDRPGVLAGLDVLALR